MLGGAERKRQPDRLSQGKEFADREVFSQNFGDFVGQLVALDERLRASGESDPAEDLLRLRNRLDGHHELFSPPEIALFERTHSFFLLKHGLFPHLPAEASGFLKGRGLREMFVAFGGPPGVGKSELAKFLTPQIDAEMVEESFELNAFLGLAYEDPDFMLRSQLFFLLDNIDRGLGGKFREGRWVSDTNDWSDIFVFMEWRRRKGSVTEEEFNVYHQVVGLFADSLIVKPDLLILLRPGSPERLMNGIRLRREADPERRGFEKAISLEDLEIASQATADAARTLSVKYGIKVLEMEVDPVQVWEADLRYGTVHRIREALGILGELIEPKPEETVKEILDFFAWHQGRLFLLATSCMFTGKSTVTKELKRELGEEMIVFQPEKALRWSDGEVLVTRDGDSVPALTIASNDIRDIVRVIAAQGITPEKNPVLGIDDAMLFVKNRDDPEAVISTLKWLMDAGFNVVINGLSLNYKGEPFTYMDYLLYWAKVDPEVRMREVTTKCALCDERARVTRLSEADGSLASHDRDEIFVGDEEFLPVCGIRHASCKDRPEDAPPYLDLMPRPNKEYEAVLRECGILD